MSDVTIERRAAAMVTLRGDLADPRLIAAVEAETGAPPPGVRRVAFGPRGSVAWMSPDELMLFLPDGAGPEAAARLSRALDGLHALAVDVSDARATFRVVGPAARETLAKGAPVDLHPAAFGVGDFRRTRLGQVAAAIWVEADGALGVMCFRSVAHHVALFLETAARPDARVGLHPA